MAAVRFTPYDDPGSLCYEERPIPVHTRATAAAQRMPEPDLATLQDLRLRRNFQDLHGRVVLVNRCIDQATRLTGELAAFRLALDVPETGTERHWNSLYTNYLDLQKKIGDFQKGLRSQAFEAVKKLPLSTEIDGSKGHQYLKDSVNKLEARNRDVLTKINEWVHKGVIQFPLSKELVENLENSNYRRLISKSAALAALCINPIVAPILRDLIVQMLNSASLQTYILNTPYPFLTLAIIAGAVRIKPSSNPAPASRRKIPEAIAAVVRRIAKTILTPCAEYPGLVTGATYGILHLASSYAGNSILAPEIHSFAYRMIKAATFVTVGSLCHTALFGHGFPELFSNPKPEPESSPVNTIDPSLPKTPVDTSISLVRKGKTASASSPSTSTPPIAKSTPDKGKGKMAKNSTRSPAISAPSSTKITTSSSPKSDSFIAPPIADLLLQNSSSSSSTQKTNEPLNSKEQSVLPSSQSAPTDLSSARIAQREGRLAKSLQEATSYFLRKGSGK